LAGKACGSEITGFSQVLGEVVMSGFKSSRARFLRALWLAGIVPAGIVAVAFFAGPIRAEEMPFAPGKFIPSYAIKYGGTQGWPSAAEAARFDLLIVSGSPAHAQVFASEAGNTWRTLKGLNPALRIYVYQNGPALYDTSPWGQLGEGWEWICREHGPDSPDRWLAIGIRFGGPLQGRPYPNERLMNLGNTRWQQYWLVQTWNKFWGGEKAPGKGTDGIFADNCGYRMPWLGQWHLEGQPDKPDEPADYVREGTYQGDLFKEHMNSFYDRAVPFLRERGLELVLNFGYMASAPEFWEELDRQFPNVFAAMEEGAFVHPWGTLGRQGNFVFHSEEAWLRQVNTLAQLKNVRALMNVHGPVISEAQDLRRMEAADASGRQAWEILWYALASFLQGYNDRIRNGAMNFTVWGYSRFYWLDEFDPKYLHLGRAVGAMERWEGTEGHIYAREFEDGWVVVNPTPKDARQIRVPKGRARLIGHAALKDPDSVPLVTEFDLPARTGRVLLREGRKLGNEDNGSLVP
jgi:hypothetical protein